ncbi:uncharacterized protein LOC131231725 [Magnolia sinica]|uniref:uncharacterized protein LOC131231725 n=1 Tax=Magnolia sinica TaxID=86752 RepID=UPI00265AA80A|nr:uncharacterized protein LOC131231725 [Magnolia sinica]
MVVALKPGKFYGSSLPRPRFFTDVKLNGERVDPLLPVLHPFLSWANEAHWSMGGLNFKHPRLLGKIEGRIQKLRHYTIDFLPQNKKVINSTATTPASSSSSVLEQVPDGLPRKRARKLSDEFDKVASSPQAEDARKRRVFVANAKISSSKKASTSLGEHMNTIDVGKRGR